MYAWDDIDVWGRECRRLARSAYAHLKKEDKDSSSFEAWSRCYERHAHRATELMKLKHQILTELGLRNETPLAEVADQ
jgi:hypothetical protein